MPTHAIYICMYIAAAARGCRRSTGTYIAANIYTYVLILLYICPHAAVYVPAYYYIQRPQQEGAGGEQGAETAAEEAALPGGLGGGAGGGGSRSGGGSGI
jgi:hypothetical protein